MTKIFITGAIFLLLFSCSEEPVKPRLDNIPLIESLRLPERWNLNATDSSIVEIKVTVAQDFADLQPATMHVFNVSSQEIFSAQLYDDGGLSGSTDLIAGDGVFRNRFKGTDISAEAGSYLFTFNVSDGAGNTAEPISKTVSFNFNQPPQIYNLITPDILESGAQPFTINVGAADVDSDPENVNVYMDLLINNTSVLAEPIQLFNDGNVAENGDVFAGDSIYSLKIDSSFAAGKQGEYKMVFSAKDEFADESNIIQSSLQIDNDRSYIISTDVPDTVFRPANIPVKAVVGDPQGGDDIQRVYFELKASDGSYIESSPGNHLQLTMFDDGDLQNHGDTEANDSEYALILQVTQNNVADVYTLEFYVQDKVDNISLMASDTLDIQ